MSKVDASFTKGFTSAQFATLAEVMALAAESDGEFGEEERAHLVGVINAIAPGKLSAHQLKAALEVASSSAAEGKRVKRLKELGAKLPGAEARKGALALAIEMVAADGRIRTSERELILEAAEALEVPVDTAADLVKQFAG